MGGNSAEREISLLSGDGVMRALRALGYDAPRSTTTNILSRPCANPSGRRL